MVQFALDGLIPCRSAEHFPSVRDNLLKMHTLPNHEPREKERFLGILGLTEREESLYRTLLDRKHGMQADDARRLLGLSSEEAAEVLESLRGRGLVTRSPGRSASYLPAPPESALGTLIAASRSRVERANVEAHRLEELFRKRFERRSSAELLEVLESTEVVAQRALQLVRAAEQEILTFDRPPYSITAQTNEDQIGAALARGVRVRAVYDREAIEFPGGIESAHAFAALGEKGRVVPRVPFKLNIVDRRVALLPLVVEEAAGVEGALLIHSSHLVDALVLLWEILWERAIPLGTMASSMDDLAAEGSLSDADRRLVDLLLTGAKTKAIARELGMGVSTVERHVKRIMALLGAETRIQAGYQLALGAARQTDA